MIIAQISDTHIALDTPDAERRIQDFERTIADINSLDPAPDVIVHTGDVVHNGLTAEYAEAAEILSRAHAPVYAMAGNKDDRVNLRAAFSRSGYLAAAPKFIDYAVEDYPVRMLMLDTVNPGSKKGEFCAYRFARLEELAARETSKPIAVFTHHPPFEVMVGPERFHFDDLAIMTQLAAAIEKTERAIAVFSGHVHRPTFGRVGAVPAVVMPSIATTLRYGDYPAHMAAKPIYFVHRYSPLGDFTTETRIVDASS